MSKYVLVTDFKKLKYNEKNLNIDGYTFKPKIKDNNNFIKVDSITVTDQKLKKKIILKEFKIVYRKLFKKIIELSDDDFDNSDAALALTEADKIKRQIEVKYKCELDKKTLEIMQKKIDLLKKSLHDKIINNTILKNMEENKGMRK